ncbi:MAG: hypothetical protein ACRDTQ_18805, partial [Micromonosporaceae bacterium]
CRSCRDRYPCRDRMDADLVLNRVTGWCARPTLGWVLAVVSAPLLFGLLLIVAGALGWAR